MSAKYNNSSSSGKDAVKARLRQYIDESCVPEPAKRKTPWAAISATALAALVVFAVTIYSLATKPDIEWQKVSTGIGETKEVLLSDGTTIWLHDDSEIFYPSSFAKDKRYIIASGEIYAQVTKNPERPFVISTDNMTVTVYGTRFNLADRKSSEMSEISLDEGVVSAVFEGVKGEFRLNPGEMLRCDNHKVSKYSFHPDQYATWRVNDNIQFIDMKLSDIAKELERRFNKKLVIKNSADGDKHYFASFINSEGLDQILDALGCKNRNTIETNTILIY